MPVMIYCVMYRSSLSAFEPGEAAIIKLHFFQFVKCFFLLAAHPHHIKQQGNIFLLLILHFVHPVPRVFPAIRLILILHFFAGCKAMLLYQHFSIVQILLLFLGGFGYIRCQCICIIAVECLFGTFIRIFH